MKSYGFGPSHGVFLSILIISLALYSARAGSASWNLNPTKGDWNNSANWTPNTIPNAATDVANFGLSSTTDISLSSSVELDSIIFDAGASAYTITTRFGALTFSGGGIVNNSGVTQSFVLEASMTLQNRASIGSSIAVTNNSDSNGGAGVLFRDTSSAGRTTFTNNGTIYFFDNASAGRATFINNPPIVAGASPPTTYFSSPGGNGAQSATFINNGATRSGDLGGATFLYSAGNFGTSRILNYGGTTSGAHGGFTECGFRAKIDNMTFVAYGGSNGGDGGSIQFYGVRSANTLVRIYGNGTFDISLGGATTIGSLAGDGSVILGSDQLTVAGSRSSTFSGTLKNHGGVIDGDGGGLTKTGNGRLILQRASIYDGDTIISGGELAVNNQSGSGTGSGAVKVNVGILSGAGSISGTVTIGTGSDSGAQLKPGRNSQGTLTILSAVTLKSDSTYNWALNSDTGAATSVAANGLAINSGAQFSLIQSGSTILTAGASFTVVNNTSATPIGGTFINLPDGGAITVGENTFHASYEGGDGNDLTLTVVP